MNTTSAGSSEVGARQMTNATTLFYGCNLVASSMEMTPMRKVFGKESLLKFLPPCYTSALNNLPPSLKFQEIEGEDGRKVEDTHPRQSLERGRDQC